jgi:omega-6 fatty acid desaturase (delta-12 desaturase)
MWYLLDVSYLLAMLVAIPAAGFLVRLFLIQHDCGHGSFFASRRANDWVGRIIGVFTLTPYGYWKRTHAIHHAGSGSLERRGLGDITTMTLREYRESPWWHRLGYRLFRNPVTLFIVGPMYQFLLQHRLPVGLMRAGWRPWLSTMGTNAGIAAVVGLSVWFIGWQATALIYLPVMIMAASLGVWLFFVQHQFEHTIWDSEPDWNLHEAALHGSSHFDLPPVLRWMTANIGIHHVHHLCSRIPFYHLPRVLKDHPELRDVGRITLWQSFSCVRLALWDETNRRLVPFSAA